jgi:hypothetical protein
MNGWNVSFVLYIINKQMRKKNEVAIAMHAGSKAL